MWDFYLLYKGPSHPKQDFKVSFYFAENVVLPYVSNKEHVINMNFIATFMLSDLSAQHLTMSCTIYVQFNEDLCLHRCKSVFVFIDRCFQNIKGKYLYCYAFEIRNILRNSTTQTPAGDNWYHFINRIWNHKKEI